MAVKLFNLIILLLIVSVNLAGAGTAWAADKLSLFDTAPARETPAADKAAAPSHGKRQKIVGMNPRALDFLAAGSPPGEATQPLHLDLFPDVALDLKAAEREQKPGGVTVNEFRIEGDPAGRAVLSNTQGIVHGTVTTGAHDVYRIQYDGQGTYRVEELDSAKFPDCGNSHEPHEVRPAGDATITTASASAKTSASTNINADGGADASADSGATIDVLVLYTPAAETAAGGGASMSSLIATAVAETNTGYANSGVVPRIRMVGSARVSYTEASSNAFDAALNAVTGTSDGVMDEIHALRDSLGADLVVLLIHDSQYCGLGWMPGSVSTANATHGFSVVAWNCATGYYSFAHEMGHNMGARHDVSVDSATVPYAYGHGYVNTSARIRSIMAYNNQCSALGFNCTRVNSWSATDRLYSGYAIGDSAATNNVALNNSAATIANYRSSVSSTYTLTVGSSGVAAVPIVASPALYGGTTDYAVTGIAAGTAITLTAPATVGSATFSTWSGCDAVSGFDCGLTLNANKSATALYTSPPIALTNGGVIELSGVAGSETIYYVTVPAGASNLTITTAGGTGDAVLYVKQGGVPTTATYDCASYAVGNDEACVIAAPAAGLWYVMVRGYTSFSGMTLQAGYTVPVQAPGAPSLTAITPAPRRLAIAFVPPAVTGGSPLVSYDATCDADGQTTRTATGPASPLIVGQLTGGIDYRCSVTATNSAGLTGPASASMTATAQPGRPFIVPLWLLLE